MAVTCSVYACTAAYTGEVTFYKAAEQQLILPVRKFFPKFRQSYIGFFAAHNSQNYDNKIARHFAKNKMYLAGW